MSNRYPGRSTRNHAVGMWAALLPGVFGLLTGGCFSRTAEVRSVKGPVTVERARVESDEPLVTSDWVLQGNRVTGHLSWSSCTTHRAWVTEQRRTVHMEPHTTAGGLLMVAGLALSVVGVATHSSTPGPQTCSEKTMQYGDEFETIDTCTSSPPNNDGSNALLAVGVLATLVGGVMYAAHPRDETTVVKSEPHSESATEPCVAPVDLADLVLVLKLGKKGFLHVALAADGSASIEVPAPARLPRGVDLPVVVYRAPPGAEGLLKRWQVVGSVHVPAAE